MKSLLLFWVFLIGYAGEAVALCNDEIPSLQRSVFAERMRQHQPKATAAGGSPAVGDLAKAQKWLKKAIEVEPTSELECMNDVIRARKALRDATAHDDVSGRGKNTNAPF